MGTSTIFTPSWTARALITGVSGFVGSHLAEYLLYNTDWRVAGTVYGPVNNVAHLKDQVAIYPAELSQRKVVTDLLQETRPNYVFHLAAQPSAALSRRDPWFTLENNIRVQLNILDAVAELDLESRVLVVGLLEEYGAIPVYHPVPEANQRPASLRTG